MLVPPQASAVHIVVTKLLNLEPADIRKLQLLVTVESQVPNMI